MLLILYKYYHYYKIYYQEEEEELKCKKNVQTDWFNGFSSNISIMKLINM